MIDNGDEGHIGGQGRDRRKREKPARPKGSERRDGGANEREGFQAQHLAQIFEGSFDGDVGVYKENFWTITCIIFYL